MYARAIVSNQMGFSDRINQTLDGVKYLRATVQYDEEFKDGAATVAGSLFNGISGLPKSVRSSNYQAGQGSLIDFFSILKDANQRVKPACPILKLINEPHYLRYLADS